MIDCVDRISEMHNANLPRRRQRIERRPHRPCGSRTTTSRRSSVPVTPNESPTYESGLHVAADHFGSNGYHHADSQTSNPEKRWIEGNLSSLWCGA